MTALSAACCARWNPPGPRASNLCFRPGTGSPRPRRTWSQKLIDPPSPPRTWQSFIPHVSTMPIAIKSTSVGGQMNSKALIGKSSLAAKTVSIDRRGFPSTTTQLCYGVRLILYEDGHLTRALRFSETCTRGFGWEQEEDEELDCVAAVSIYGLDAIV